jgi:hypothetical protein
VFELAISYLYVGTNLNDAAKAEKKGIEFYYFVQTKINYLKSTSNFTSGKSY